VTVRAHSKEAETRLSLPVTVTPAEGIAFDADQYMWILKSGSAYKVNLHTDNMLVDFDNKIIYLHESYDSVEVSPS
jgi:hypothetical protein